MTSSPYFDQHDNTTTRLLSSVTLYFPPTLHFFLRELSMTQDDYDTSLRDTLRHDTFYCDTTSCLVMKTIGLYSPLARHSHLMRWPQSILRKHATKKLKQKTTTFIYIILITNPQGQSCTAIKERERTNHRVAKKARDL